ncbi:peptidoglycan DD-metalloendopeptidase family protein [Desulfofundulus thermobenzoicus]|uniref:Peptidoglycan DD-metalloendopeptidase family protein n=1 Tax=Desulfofundulus thermobenzoicus TaxID=29376 RepID=A0A6N7IU71_9FIRM|nr:M23 family metallopeptidase [Desulfofundulus thermobenzoicus]MQL53103.1 peptidoglycan DD-metalloendopeptidase family protein [Desulfofundulus thermobenzoicus]
MRKLVKKQLKKMAPLVVAAGVLAGGYLAGLAPLFASPDEAILTDQPYGGLPPVEEAGNRDEEGVVYRVQPGDTLLAIAGRLGVPVSVLQETNGLRNADLILPGQELRVPGRLKHRVASGETLSEIARRYHVPLWQLAAANGLANPDRVNPGEELIIPAGEQEAVAVWEPAPSLPVEQLAWPVVGRVSSPFGWREGRPHHGVDIAAAEGEPIRAVKDGRVVFAGPRGTYGLAVIINHGQGLETLYAHASKLLVSPGQTVQEGQVIALVGSTGRSTGPHLHLEVRLNGVCYDPLWCLTRMRT